MRNNERRSRRLASFDYSQAAMYFVTLCSHERRCVFGRVESQGVVPNVYGRIVREEWERSALLRESISLDTWVLMPNHLHALVLTHEPPIDSKSHHVSAQQRPSRSLSSLVALFKGASTRRINAYRTERDLPQAKVWQRNYYDHIVRNEDDLSRIRDYIQTNPALGSSCFIVEAHCCSPTNPSPL